METHSDTFVVVYQFGKVASTSLVATLNAIDGIEAVQSHFLGRNALVQMVPMMIDHQTDQYFFHHQLGQFQRNVTITRRINEIKAGKSDSRLVILSLAREPMEWFRSSLTQDISGYQSTLTGLAQHMGAESEDPDRLITLGTEIFIEIAAKILEAGGGVDLTMARTRQGAFDPAGHAFVPKLPGIREIYTMMLRPLNWFSDHFQVATGLSLADFGKSGGFWHAQAENADHLIIRYEDIATLLTPAMASLGFTVGPVMQKNVSAEKPHAAAIKAAFAEDRRGKLAAIFAQSAYSRFFGYADPGP